MGVQKSIDTQVARLKVRFAHIGLELGMEGVLSWNSQFFAGITVISSNDPRP
jgi:hypothetical protein